ncbi:MAG: DUF2807 domain-containing protein [Legionellales bacterium]|nr:DUF2807 domain-containing protein [Legionellales bacterium]
MKRIFLLFIWIVLVNISYGEEKYLASNLSNQIKPNKEKPYKIIINGGIQLERFNNIIDPTISFTGNEEDLKNVNVVRDKDQISINLPKRYNAIAPIILKVNTNNIHSINHNGETILYAGSIPKKKKYKKNSFSMTANEVGNKFTPNDGVAYKIKIVGDLELHRINNSTEPTLAFTGNKIDLDNIDVDRKGELIIISKPKKYKKISPILLTVNTKNIHSINYKGAMTVYSGKDILKNKVVHADDLPNLKIPKNTKFREIEISGNIGLKLIQSRKAPFISFKGNPISLRNIEIDVDDERVNISNVDSRNVSPVYLIVNAKDLRWLRYNSSVTIYSNITKPIDLHLEPVNTVSVIGPINVRNLYLRGDGQIHFNKLNSNNLSIDMEDSVFAIIQGKIMLTKLNMSDCSWLKLFWNDSEYLKVTGTDKAFAQVAGRVSTIDINLDGESHFNGKFLRANIAYVRSYDTARVDIYAKSISHAIASDSSNIYSYRSPTMKFDSMNTNGSIMDRR